MRWIPIQWVDLDNRPPILLPCPALDLIRLASAIDHDRSLESLLRQSPPLILVALSGYRQHFHQPPSSARELVQWCQASLIPMLLRHAQDQQCAVKASEAVDMKQLRPFFEDFFRIRNNRKLRRSLRRFLTRFAGVPKQDGKRLVKQLVGKQLRADQFHSNRIRRKKTALQVESSWQAGLPSNVDLQRILESVWQGIESNAEFDARLTDQKLAAMKQLAYGASHEINNPLANISTRAQTLLAHETDPEKRHKLSVIYEQAMRAHEMISDMMLFAHPPAIEIKRVSIRLLMSKIIREVESLLNTTPSTSLEVVIGAGVDHLDLDSTQFAVLIKNLIRNSVEAILSCDQRHGHILVRVDATADGEIEFSVWDNGLEITDHVGNHLFDPFFSGREAGRGLGFGLSKVWTITKLHGGKVWLDSSLKSGTRFVVRLPVDRTDHASSGLPEFSIANKQLAREEEAA